MKTGRDTGRDAEGIARGVGGASARQARIAVDTNVLVRYLAWDDDMQSPIAAEIIETAETLILSNIVLCETVWVLRRAYKLPAMEIAAALRGLIETATVELDRPAAEAGLISLETGGDFADGVVLLEAQRAKANHLVTFDKSFAGKTKTGQIKLLV